jgi:hypothetical protein
MDGTFAIAVDVDRHLVQTRLAGFFDAELLRRYLDARAAAFRQLRCGPNQHLSITDVREMKIQSQDMVAAFADILSDPAYRSRRLAFVVATSLARMQLTRALGDRIGKEVALFMDTDQAERWLFAEDRQAA